MPVMTRPFRALLCAAFALAAHLSVHAADQPAYGLELEGFDYRC